MMFPVRAPFVEQVVHPAARADAGDAVADARSREE